MTSPTLTVLISAKVVEQVQTMAQSQYALKNVRFVPYHGERIDEETLKQIDIAFVSRDVTGLSTKYVLEPHTETFYQMMEEAPNLQWVQVHSAGLDRPIYVRLREKGVKLTNASGALSSIVAQSVLTGMLALNRRFRFLENAQREHTWAPLLGELMPPDLEGQHVLLAGWGAIGQTIQRYLDMLGMRVTVLRNSEGGNDGRIPMIHYDNMQSVLEHIDWLVLACPLTDRTRGLVSRHMLNVIKPGAHLVNVSRGEVVDETAMIEALKDGTLAGAYLDVFEKEPLQKDSPLWDMANVIVSPHTAGHSAGNEKRVSDIFLENLDNWVHGRPLRNLAR